MELDELVDEWLTLPEAAARSGLSVTKLRDLIRDGRLAAVRRGSPPALALPAAFVRDGALLKGLVGTLTVLHDNGYTAEESLRWLFSVEDTMGTAPITAITALRLHEVNRVAQMLAI